MMQSLLSASLMMALVGLVALTVTRLLAIQSWRLRSWLMVAVLLQGAMLVRSPIHLGWIESPPTPPVVANELVRSSDRVDPLAEPASAETVSSTEDPIFAGAEQSVSSSWSNLVVATWLTLTIGVWLAVAATVILMAMIRYLRVILLIRRLRPAPAEWVRRWRAVLQESPRFARSRRCEMLLADSVGPLMVRRPSGYVLIVPEDYWNRLDERQRRSVMLHELAHLERRDVWRQSLARMIAAIHWFNPFAWWALRQYELAAECACDQRVAREGKSAVASFASALVELVEWQADRRCPPKYQRGVGFQAMAAPPLTLRISRLLAPNFKGDTLMKRIALAFLTLALMLGSFFQIRLTTAQENEPHQHQIDPQLRVIDKQVAQELNSIAINLDLDDPTTKRFGQLLDDTSGKLAIAGYLNSLSGKSREAARAEAIPRFVDHYFVADGDGQLTTQAEHAEKIERWIKRSQRLSEHRQYVQEVADDYATRMDTSSEAGGLFKRVLQDPQLPVALLLFDSGQGGGDIVSRYIGEALGRILVDLGNHRFTIVESRRAEVEKQVQRFELADQISQKLARHLPSLASEYATDDEKHERLVEYLRNPMTANVVAIHLSKENPANAGAAVSELHRHFEETSRDTPTGLKIGRDEAWEQLDEIFAHVDRASNMLPRVKDRLAEICDGMETDDPLSERFVAQMKKTPLAVLIAAEIPYADGGMGAQLRAQLSEVLTEIDGKMAVKEQREEELANKSRQLLQACRQIRRFMIEVDDLMERIGDRQLVDRLGDQGRYIMLDEIRRFTEMYRPEPVELMRQDLLAQVDSGQLRVREERRELVRQLVEQSEQVRAEANKDDF